MRLEDVLTSAPMDRLALMQEGLHLLSEKVYSVVELEDFRKKASAFREKAARLLGAEPPLSSLTTSPKDILDWVTFEKTSVHIVQDRLASGSET
jgi:hypothetical protein